MQERIERLRRRFRALGVSSFLVTRLSNIRWLCGFTGSNGMLYVTKSKAIFLTDGRYTNQAREQVEGADVVIFKKGFVSELKQMKAIRPPCNIGIEAQALTVEMLNLFKKEYPTVNFLATANVVEQLAAVKIEDEIAKIRTAVEITDKVFDFLLGYIRPGLTELEVAAEIAYRHMKLGASKDAFNPIVASGWRSALPHGIASDKVIENGDLLTLDFGCVYQGYASDMTRTVVVGKASDEQRKVYETVLKSQLAGISAVCAGAVCMDVDAISRKVIASAGYGDKFTHSLGHGLGLEVHAFPRLAVGIKQKLEPGMVVTVEPGIYINGWGGVRIEDDVVVREEGAEVLNRSAKELIVL